MANTQEDKRPKSCTMEASMYKDKFPSQAIKTNKSYINTPVANKSQVVKWLLGRIMGDKIRQSEVFMSFSTQTAVEL